MIASTHPLSDLLFALIGPIVWAAHFFIAYLIEGMLCAPDVSGGAAVRSAAGVATAIALAILIAARMRYRYHVDNRSRPLSFARPLIDLSVVAVLWTSIPLLVLQSCQAAGS